LQKQEIRNWIIREYKLITINCRKTKYRNFAIRVGKFYFAITVAYFALLLVYAINV